MARIQSGGLYKFINAKGGTVIDLSGGDNRSIIGYPETGGPNQAWVFEQTSDGPWTIRSVSSGKFLGVEGNYCDGVQVVAVDSPFRWDIWPDEQNPGHYRFFVPNTQFVLDLADHGNPTPGTPVTLWTQWEGTNQSWSVEPAQ